MSPEDPRRQLGKISGAWFGLNDRGMMDFYIGFNFGGSHQGFTGYRLCTFDKDKDRSVGTAGGMDLALQILTLFKVKTFEELVGRYAYALRDSDSWGAQIVGVELPEAEKGGRFTIAEWLADWGLGGDS